MKHTVIKFGSYSFLTAVILFLSALVLGQDLSYEAQEVLGYSSIILSVGFVFFGIKSYRDKENNGTVSFGKAFTIGLLITLFAAIGFALIDFIYTTYINPEFMEQYVSYQMENLASSYSGEELISEKQKLKDSMEEMSNAAIAAVMFATVLIIGIVISLISSLVLHKK